MLVLYISVSQNVTLKSKNIDNEKVSKIENKQKEKSSWYETIF